ncbi:peptide chain release factor 1 [Kallipyga gabonensis]|uniref:peptide chain release factor 1 n=1 Tax=Kallipyga gabonensis TaxID=1686287 RepID=UPI0006B521C6|nr:peptide chain release factor 1 [Kallipyga gabonensis]
MFENLKDVNERLRAMEARLADPDLLSDMDRWRVVNRDYNALKPIAETYNRYEEAVAKVREDEEMLEVAEDPEMVDMLQMDKEENRILSGKLEEELKILLIPKDPNDYKNVIVEIRAGAGGDEAGLFAGDLYRMYHMYADKQGYATEEIDAQSQGIGGIREATFMMKGEGAYSRMKYESGVHRVQRVPETESQGRIQTSTATVAVLPEAEEVDVEIDPNDIRVDVYRSTGHGGQCVNTTDSAVRLTHEPTGIVVTCQDEKSQIKNKAKAMQVLRARLYEMKLEEQQKELSEDRKSQVGTGDRSERIRTYNFQQGRVTDHRINRTIYQLQDFLDGDIEEMIHALQLEDQMKKLDMMTRKSGSQNE